MTALLRTVLVLLTAVAAAALGLPAAPAQAHHDHWCPDYTAANSTEQEYALEGIQIPFEVYHLSLDISKGALEDLQKAAPDPAEPPFEAAIKVLSVTMAVTTGVIGAFKLARFGLSVVNNEADGCRFDEHWLGTDDLLAAAVRKDLAATTPPVAQFVLPSEAGGLLDETGVGVHDVVVRTVQDLCSGCAAAKDYLARAVTAREAGRFKEAYGHYRRAYVAAAR